MAQREPRTRDRTADLHSIRSRSPSPVPEESKHDPNFEQLTNLLKQIGANNANIKREIQSMNRGVFIEPTQRNVYYTNIERMIRDGHKLFRLCHDIIQTIMTHNPTQIDRNRCTQYKDNISILFREFNTQSASINQYMMHQSDDNDIESQRGPTHAIQQTDAISMREHELATEIYRRHDAIMKLTTDITQLVTLIGELDRIVTRNTELISHIELTTTTAGQYMTDTDKQLEATDTIAKSNNKICKGAAMLLIFIMISMIVAISVKVKYQDGSK